jgi:hypothetical protein
MHTDNAFVEKLSYRVERAIEYYLQPGPKGEWFDVGDAPFAPGDEPYDSGGTPSVRRDAPFEGGDAPFGSNGVPLSLGGVPVTEVEARKVAEQLVERKDIRQYLCPALQAASKDAFEIGRTMVAILIPLALAGTIVIPLHPLVIGIAAVMIARMGVASFCAGYDKEAKAKEE